MYEEYMQNFYNYPTGGYANTYDMMPNMLNNNYYPYMQNASRTQNTQSADLEEMYPEIYKVIYPMVQKVCTQNNKPLTKETVDNMVGEVSKNIEPEETEAKDLIKILILRELQSKLKICNNCRRNRTYSPRPNPNPWNISLFQMYDYQQM